MPPLRFKAVCTETGEDFGADNLAPEAMYFKHGNVVQRFWLEFLGDADTEPKIQLCQSTGLTDAKGKEVFFGDVLTTPSGSVLFSVEFFRDQVLGQNLDNKVLSNLSDIELLTVIGNRWEPIERLRERAKALAKG